ncbi:MAG TPA: CRISPR-associated protein Csx15 [Anaerolineae bacterium]|nr:MAG: hypothetical protein BWY25_03015 [Chloroflexi bacterium ADurb.Bin222]HOC22389.1 CRISPR-associated protein Csx15 [Anaerolineae bacterium]HQM14893.1 CRISPR-associated protein Csx15 [Anaerolineae bacterium]
MLILNFSHPLTAAQLAQLEALTNQLVERVLDIPTYFDPAQPFAQQVAALIDQLELTPTEWQTLPLLVNPPTLNVIAIALLAELHGRMGYFPPVLRLRSVPGSLPPRFEVAEIINLQAVRDHARQRR